MVSVNDATGDLMRTKGATDSYRTGWDRIFGNKEKTVQVPAEVVQEQKTQQYTHGYFLEIVEHERSYGQRIDGYIAFPTEVAAKKFIEDELRNLPSEVPDCYVRYNELGWKPVSAHVSKEFEHVSHLYFDKLKKANLKANL